MSDSSEVNNVPPEANLSSSSTEIMLERVAGTEDISLQTLPVDMTATSDGVRRYRKRSGGAISGQEAVSGSAAVTKAAQEYFRLTG